MKHGDCLLGQGYSACWGATSHIDSSCAIKSPIVWDPFPRWTPRCDLYTTSYYHDYHCDMMYLLTSRNLHRYLEKIPNPWLALNALCIQICGHVLKHPTRANKAPPFLWLWGSEYLTHADSAETTPLFLLISRYIWIAAHHVVIFSSKWMKMMNMRYFPIATESNPKGFSD